MKDLFNHLKNKIVFFLKGDRRAKYPRSLMEVEEIIYPYFLKAFDAKPEDYEQAIDLKEQCVEDVYRALKGLRPKIEMDQQININ